MTNFDFLKDIPQFAAFADVAVAAEKILMIDPEASVMNCRRAMEFAVKWMYSVDDMLVMPYQDKLVSLLNTEEFKGIVDADILRRMDFIRRVANQVAHTGRKLTLDQAKLCLENLYIFLDFVAYCYADDYQEGQFDAGLLEQNQEILAAETAFPDIDLEALIAENKALKAELTSRREEQKQTYVPKPLELSEYATRKQYIDTMLIDAGWMEGKNWLNEVEVYGMPNKSGSGFADYVLYDDAHRPLAVIEAKKTCADVASGRQQAELYADSLERQYGRRPVIFLTNGFETRIVDGQYPERQVSCIYSRRDLEKWFNLKTMRGDLGSVRIDKKIAGRYYQEEAIKAVCESFDKKNRRKALLVMATGSGKTRTVIALCDVLLQNGWVKNILFLADRTSLVTQAKRSFVNMLPDLSVANLCEEKSNLHAHCIFSTYQTMINCIDATRDEDGKLFTSGHFDLVICDEAHRSIYNKYKDIFTYFDAPLVGLTATPKDEIDKNTYSIFELEKGVPTYGYELAQAVKDGYLVDFLSVETKLKFLEEGIAYDELSDEDKEAYENTFVDENGQVVERIQSSALNTWIFNDDTIRQVLDILMTHGIHTDYGEKLGKTIIFAKNHAHAEKIFEVFNKEYSHLPGYAKVIDNRISHSQSLIDQFSEPDKLPQIAISVDMLDTGIDVPEILNLVFFKKVMSKAKFWQMIGRGTRLCKGLACVDQIDGAYTDKRRFLIFDYCGNFEFFRAHKEGYEAKETKTLSENIFGKQVRIAMALQESAHAAEAEQAWRAELVETCHKQVAALNPDLIAVKMRRQYVEKYQRPEAFNLLTEGDKSELLKEIAPLVHSDDPDEFAKRFDNFMYGLILAHMEQMPAFKYAKKQLCETASLLERKTSIPQIKEKLPLLREIHTDAFWDANDILLFEKVRKELRDLIRFLDEGTGEQRQVVTNLTDPVIDRLEGQQLDAAYDFEDYRAKVNRYVNEHGDTLAIHKLTHNIPLSAGDYQELEHILTCELGSKADYQREFGDTPFGLLIRRIAKLDHEAAMQAFSKFINDQSLNQRQIAFVHKIINHMELNGYMENVAELTKPPFDKPVSFIKLFDANTRTALVEAIHQVRQNAVQITAS